MTDDVLNKEEEVEEPSLEGIDDPKEDFRHAAKLKNAAMSAIQQFENKVLSASLTDHADGDEEGSVSPVPEFLDEEKERLRDELYESLRHTFLTSVESRTKFTSRFYEESVYLLVADRIRRSVGYYQALQRGLEDVHQNNRELGEPKGIEMSLDSIQKVLAGLDEVDFVRNLGISLGIFTPDLDEIVKNVIRKEFAPLRRREGEE